MFDYSITKAMLLTLLDIVEKLRIILYMDSQEAGVEHFALPPQPPLFLHLMQLIWKCDNWRKS